MTTSKPLRKVVNDLLNQKILSKEYDGTKIVCDPFTHAENAIAVQKGKDDLLAFINQCIDSIMKTEPTMHFGKNGSMLPVKGKKRQQKKIQQQKMRRLLNKTEMQRYFYSGNELL